MRIAVTALALATLLVAPSPAQAAVEASDYCDTTSIRSCVLFNDPSSGDAVKREAIDIYIAWMIDGAASGSTIRVNVYQMQSAAGKDRIMRALINAKNNSGVHVQVLIDSSNVDVTDLRNALGTTTSTALNASWYRECGADSGCITHVGNNSVDIDHNKYVLFTSTRGKSNVFIQTSQNFSTGTLWNNSVTITGTTSIYPSYNQQFLDSLKYSLSGSQPSNYYAQNSASGSSSNVWFYPRTDGGNVYLDQLNKISTCSYNGAQTDIRVATFLFTNNNIADRLKTLRAMGCWVDVVLTLPTDSTNRTKVVNIVNSLKAGNVQVTAYEQSAGSYLHSKYLLITDVSGGPLVFTGSANYGYAAYTDEAVLQVKAFGSLDQADMHAVYLSNFYAVRNHGVRQ